MLKKIGISNIALIENAELDFSAGMNCLTGETGAGKSIIIDSIGALLGSRVKKEIIRSGCASGKVRGVFCGLDAELVSAIGEIVPDISFRSGAGGQETKTGGQTADGGYGGECGGAELVIEREISVSGRNSCKVNGVAISSAELKKIGAMLIDIHGQSESRLLTDEGTQLHLIDISGGDELLSRLADYRVKLSEYRRLRKDLEALSGSPAERARTTDLLAYQIREIDAAQLSPDEDEYLAQRASFLANAERNGRLLRDALAICGDDSVSTADSAGILELLGTVRSDISRAAEHEASYEGLLRAAETIYFEFEDFIRELGEAALKADYDPQEAESVNRRIDYLYRLKSKYGETYDEIIRFRNGAAERLAFLNDSEQNAADITARLNDLADMLLDAARGISELRRLAGERLCAEITEELKDLEMASAVFRADVDFSFEPSVNGFPDFGSDGLDHAEFMISANPGQPLKPLSRTASGGELSRIMLAIKTVRNQADNIPTLIFDEIDTGISGIAAKKIAAKMKKLSGARQVICVTHHAQLAAAADSHIYISKSVSGGNTSTRAVTLEGEERVAEIARLLDGNNTSAISLTHARELIKEAAGE